MINKLLLAAAVCVGSMALTETTSEAGNCYRGRSYATPYRSGYAYRAPVVASPIYRVPAYRYVSPGYRPYSTYRPGYGGYIGPSIRFGYGGYPGYYGYGRSGISIGFGF